MIEVVVAPSALYLMLTRERLRQGIEVAAQNIFDRQNGAFTGEISVGQIKDAGITWTILGHSERRVILQEESSVSHSTEIPGGTTLLNVSRSLLRGRLKPL
jgi:triosephosphate isomerase